MSDCFQPRAVCFANEVVLNEKIDVLIGPACVTGKKPKFVALCQIAQFRKGAIAAGYVAAFYDMPIYLWGATVSPALTNTTVFPTVNNVNVNTDTSVGGGI
ncbi:hypothetical protein niasHT_000363 [Heterodera trifolii]|uniref:Uncharacterized protein n=1 Tax=Heterodera trifolii TaxID=157864 RepID=A0ABD2MC56_9BILA